MNTHILKNIKLMYEFDDCCMDIKPGTIVIITTNSDKIYTTDANSVKVTIHSLIGFKINNVYKIIPLSLIKEITYICENSQPF